ncbi:MAG: LptF/LptG family permease, partial [Candidatus Omnitrophica bacterium]|nr:LptF/LptG family permease [Candidatus Omnitrophota bacterium]
RYFLSELMAPFFLSVSLFTFIFLVGNLVKLADLLVNKGVNIIDIVKILLLLLPQLVIFILPTSAIATVLLVFGGFAQNNEITAIKASGVNVLRVMIPVMLIAFLLSLVTLFFVDQIQPRVHYVFRSVMNDLIIQKPEAYIESGRFVKDFKGYILRVQDVEGKRLHGVTIFQPQEGKPTRTIIAEWGEITSSPEDHTLALKLYSGISDEPNPDNPSVLYKMHFDTFLLPSLSLANTSTQKVKRKMKDLSLNELILILRNMKQYRDNLLSQGHDLGSVNSETRDLALEAKAEIQRKVSFAFATFSFVLIGLPLAIVTRRGEAVVSFSLSMIVVAVYYILSIWGKTIAVHGILPAVVALWIPNVVVIGVALFLMMKVIRL